jgi:hypothetical protein
MNAATLPPPSSHDPVPTGAGAAEAQPDEAAASSPETAPRSYFARHGDSFLYLGLALLVGSAWQITRMGLLTSGDDTSYWIAVVGGLMMVVLFTYPLRKHVKSLRGLGKVKWWFWFHLFLGVAGPWLILVHSTFHIGSLNAGVALISMGIVVASGVIGRFINVRIHRGLDGERTSLRALSERAGFIEGSVRSQLHFAPAVEERLLAFEQHELRAEPGWATHLRQVTILPMQQAWTCLRCVLELRGPLRARAAANSWTAAELKRRERRARRLVGRFLLSVVRVAQYTAYERVFALWHIAHLPFVYLLVISACVHVIAVHAY